MKPQSRIKKPPNSVDPLEVSVNLDIRPSTMMEGTAESLS